MTKGLDIESVSAAHSDIRAEHYRLTENGLIISWNAEIVNPTVGTLFTLEVVMTESGRLSDMISINSSMLAAEVYMGNEIEIHNLTLEFVNESVEPAYALHQNEPNPFVSESIVGFELPHADEASLSIFDVEGKLLKKYTGSFVKGYNEILINRIELGISGIGYYQLDSGEFSQTKKIIILD